MVTSPEITVKINSVVTPNMLGVFCNIQPREGNLPLGISIEGWLLFNSQYPLTDPIVNDETIEIQVYKDGNWQTVTTLITASHPSADGRAGYYLGSIMLQAPDFAAGTYRFRAYYAGNASKGMV